MLDVWRKRQANASRLRLEATADQRLRLQRALFPEGLRWKRGTFGTRRNLLGFQRVVAELPTEK